MGTTSKSNRKRINNGTRSYVKLIVLLQLRTSWIEKRIELGATYHSSKSGSMANRRKRSGSAEEIKWRRRFGSSECLFLAKPNLSYWNNRNLRSSQRKRKWFHHTIYYTLNAFLAQLRLLLQFIELKGIGNRAWRSNPRSTKVVVGRRRAHLSLKNSCVSPSF